MLGNLAALEGLTKDDAYSGRGSRVRLVVNCFILVGASEGLYCQDEARAVFNL